MEEILSKYWGYPSFRPGQKEIIESVLAGIDTLALLPTGGGKSICYQVPAMYKEGICIVVSPLIALMKDQVAQLKQRGIRAIAIYSGMGKREVDIQLDNCVYGKVKFLYVSPERMKTDLFRARLQKMPVNLLAIDEAHCISQWGYDFRPPYLEIAEIRALLPEVPCMALTATATPEVQQDIVEKLSFKEGFKVFINSFERPNLSFSVRETDDKYGKMLEVLQKIPGAGIVYARSRKLCEELAIWLRRNGISADYYHAGLSSKIRDQKQEDWTSNNTRIIVATNAFGMGIDKPDVRVVVHVDIPDTPEAYYQEAGRGGRDLKNAFSVLIFQENDIDQLRKKVMVQFPEAETLKRVYQAICNALQLAVGVGELQSYEIDLEAISETFGISQVDLYYSLKRLGDLGYLYFEEGSYQYSRLHIRQSAEDLYKLQVVNKSWDVLFKTILRIYGGELFSDYMQISISKIAHQLNVNVAILSKTLAFLHQKGFVDFVKGGERQKVVFIQPRQAVGNMVFKSSLLEERKQTMVRKAEVMIDYVLAEEACRMEALLAYFGEKYDKKCHMCDVCITQKRRSKGQEDQEIAVLYTRLKEIEEVSVAKIFQDFNWSKERKVQYLREVLEQGTVEAKKVLVLIEQLSTS